jgi:NIPSNAP
MKDLWDRPRRIAVCAIALLSFAAGSLTIGSWMHVTQANADNNRIFEIHVYHALPGKLPVLESRFRDTLSPMLAKRGLNVVGFWTVPEDASPYWNNTFVFIVAHSNIEGAKKHWAEFNADPAFQAVIKSEKAAPTLTTIDRVYMHPTDFSPMK